MEKQSEDLAVPTPAASVEESEQSEQPQEHPEESEQTQHQELQESKEPKNMTQHGKDSEEHDPNSWTDNQEVVRPPPLASPSVGETQDEVDKSMHEARPVSTPVRAKCDRAGEVFATPPQKSYMRSRDVREPLTPTELETPTPQRVIADDYATPSPVEGVMDAETVES